MKKNRRQSPHSRSGGNDSKLKKFGPLFGLVLLAIVIAMLLWPKSEIVSPQPEGYDGFPTKTVEATEAIIYLDNSKSMIGYAHGSEFIDAMADLMSIYSNTTACCINDSIKITSANELTDKLTRNLIKYKGASLLSEDLKSIVGQIGSKKIAFFVTDGIMSGSDADIRQSKQMGHRYNIDHKQDLMNDISAVFRGKDGIGAAIYRMKSQFRGQYFCYDNSHDSINAVRAYYVIALGQAGVVADFKQKLVEKQKQKIFKFRQEDEIDFIEKKAMSQNLSLTAGEKDRGSVTLSIGCDSIEGDIVYIDVQKIKSSAKSGAFINFMISKDAFKNYSLSCHELAENLRVSIDGTEQKIKAEEDSLRKTVSFQLNMYNLSLPSGGNKVRIRIPYFTPAWIDEVSNEDDSFMIAREPDESTFLFSYFINGIKNNGILKDNGFCIYDKTVTIKRK